MYHHTKLGFLTDGKTESELVIRIRTSLKVKLKICMYFNKYINICSRTDRKKKCLLFQQVSKNIVKIDICHYGSTTVLEL